ncbi:hypothetical protein C8R45DRAFT_1010519 [Mycena sanguinolenta]|nr:hypothetical protein C8R45DRAFT_1010519 [Mycena sanguinolenta]
MLLPEGEAEDWAGIVKKIGLHMGTTYMDLTKGNEDRIPNPSARPLVGVHYGLVFSGQACVVAQYLLASSPGFLPIPGVAVSHAVQVTPGGPAPVPIFALILGVLAQTNAAAAPRDPAVDLRLKGTWFHETVPALRLAARFVPNLQAQPSAPPAPPSPSAPAPLPPPPPPPPPPGAPPAPQSQSGTGGSSAGGTISSGAASSFSNFVYARGCAQQQVLLHFDLPGAHTMPLLLISISREYLANRYRSLSPSSSLASSSAASSVVSTPPSSPELKSEHTLPNSEEAPTPRTTTPSHLILEPTLFHSGHFATVSCGQFSLDNQPSSRIILKSYPTQYFSRLLLELDVYAALAPLAVIVPRLYTVLAPLDLAWAGLVLENAGTELGNSSQGWDEVDLTHEDRRRLYGALTELHSVGVVHGDLTPRNVVRRSRGALCLVDFGQSTLHHVCSGARCPELFALHKALAL